MFHYYKKHKVQTALHNRKNNVFVDMTGSVFFLIYENMKVFYFIIDKWKK